MRRWTFLVVICAAAALSVGEGDEGEWLTVRTAQGPVRGRKDPTGDFYAFYNIHYATAPKGRDKFKAPLPPPVWLTTLDAVDEGIVCPQAKLEFAEILPAMKQQEDCLIANVYVPETDEKYLPVLVYVHGGAFQVGFGELLKYRALMKTKKVIIVTFNYRLGIHGFLCLGTEDAPGNAGMKDQVALLRWVNKNIATFGGNPKDVTIAGYSAGSVSVDLLMLSTAAEGLFNKVIPESGASLAPFAIQPDPVEIAKTHAKKLNFTNVENIYALGEFYKTASMEVLTSDAFFDRTDFTFVFSPCVERDIGQGVFLDDTPLNILQKGKYKKVPLLYGFSNMEGLFRIDLFDVWKQRMNDNFTEFFSADLNFDDDEQKEKVSRKIKEFYFGDNLVDESTVLSYVDYFSDVMFAYPTLWATKLHVDAGHDQVYLYEYSFVDEDTPVVPHTSVRGANHCAQSMAVGDGKSMMESDETKVSEKLKNMKKVMRDIWLSFVTSGNPTPGSSSLPIWRPAGHDRSPHMSLGEVMELKGPLLEARARFWDQIYENHYRPPVPPPNHPPRPHTEL